MTTYLELFCWNPSQREVATGADGDDSGTDADPDADADADAACCATDWYCCLANCAMDAADFRHNFTVPITYPGKVQFNAI